MLSLPLFEDDYPLIAFTQRVGFWGALADPVFRPRVTLSWILLALWRMVHLTPVVYHMVSLAVHIANAWLLYVLLLAWPSSPIRRAAFWATAFFAIAEGHQEAVVWVAAMSELLQFLFGGAALYCFIRSQKTARPAVFTVAGAALFAMALLSKESAVIWLPIFALAIPWEARREGLRKLIPYAAIELGAVALFAITARHSFHYSDGSFSLHSPFVITWVRNFGRLLWVWGVIALGAMAYWRNAEFKIPAAIALLWIGLGLVPYTFLTYSAQIPSRHTYLASAGLAVLVGLAFDGLLRTRLSRKLAMAVALAAIVHNTGILWLRKRAQFAKRAEPTEQIIRLAQRTAGPIWASCFPHAGIIASEAVHLATGRPASDVLLTPAEAAGRPVAAEFCYPATSR